MDECIVCFQETDVEFYPENRPTLCICKYRIHDDCYKTWLQKTNASFNCVICHAEIKNNTDNYTIFSMLPFLVFLVIISIILTTFAFFLATAIPQSGN